jgi:hypothetical protein
MIEQNPMNIEIANPEKTARIKAVLLAYIREHEDHGLSFVNLKDAIGADADGETEIDHGEFDNIVFWTGMSLEFVAAFRELMTERVIELNSTPSLTYMIDGRMLRLPLAKRLRHYKEPHWAPVTARVHHE